MFLDRDNLAKLFVIVFLMLYSLVSISLHYLTWFTPFAMILMLKSSQFSKGYYWLILLQAIYKLKKRITCAGLFAPLNPDFFLGLPSMREFMNSILPFDWIDFVKIFRYAFVIIAAYFFVKLLKELFYKKKLKLRSIDDH